MATAFIQYNRNIVFYIADEYMQLLFHYIKNEIVKPQYNFVNKEDLIFNLTFHIEGYSGGMLTLGWGGEI